MSAVISRNEAHLLNVGHHKLRGLLAVRVDNSKLIAEVHEDLTEEAARVDNDELRAGFTAPLAQIKEPLVLVATGAFVARISDNHNLQ